MEAEPIVLPDNTVIDTSKPPPSFNFPKPDFSAVISDDGNEPPVNEKTEGPLTKPTFKNALQAKKRLQAFSSNRSLPSSPSAKKIKSTLNIEEQSEEGIVKKTLKKGNYHDDKAKAVIEEIEELKREELNRLNFLKSRSKSRSRSRSRSRSHDKERFKKVDKKARNYRKRSPTPEKPKRAVVVKKTKKYPKNWQEFSEFESTFDLNRDLEVSPPKGNNELLKQILFESPSLPIIPFKMKTVNKEEKIIPFEYIRYTRTKPVLPYSVNCVAIKERFLPRKLILESLPKDIVNKMESLYSNSLKFRTDSNIKNKGRTWFPKIWKDSENECKLLEKSVGLSFLQTYTGEEEENELVVTEEKLEGEKKEQLEVQKLDVKKDAINKSDSKKKKKHRKTEEQSEGKPEIVEKKKKKKHRKGKKKRSEENDIEDSDKKKKHKKDKKKKEKRSKEKKTKHKKVSKEKKKKDMLRQDEEVQMVEKQEKQNKQQVIEELKKIEEKLAKKREQDKMIKIEKKVEKDEKMEKERCQKRKYSEREDSVKRIKHEKHKRETDNSIEIKTENTSRNKIEKGTKIDISDLKLEEKFVEKNDKPEKYSEKNKPKIAEENLIKDDYKKLKSFEDIDNKYHRKKSRWSDATVKKADIEYRNSLNIEEEIKRIDEVIKKHEEFNINEGEVVNTEEIKKNETVKERTPDTEEYHSHWESDDDITTSSARHQSMKMNRSWESDEELFERTYSRNKPTSESYTNLEIPLNIKNFSIRRKWDDQPPYLDTVTEFKLLEEERRSLSEERRKLELEKQKILKMQEEAKIELEEKKVPAIEEPKEIVRMRSSTPEIDVIKVKKEKTEVADFSFDSLNNSLLSNVSSTESNFPIAVLENEYEEFIKAVSSDSSLQPKKKPERRSSKDSPSSFTSSSSSSESDHKKKKRKKKKKKKKKSRDCLLVGKGNNIFNEFDIPVPSDLPEIVPTPVPVPSPIETILPLTNSSLLINPIIDLKEKSEKSKDPGLDLTKPFVFSSITLPNKKQLLVDNSNLNLNDDSDSADFTDKFLKKSEEKEAKKAEEKIESVKQNDVSVKIRESEFDKVNIKTVKEKKEIEILEKLATSEIEEIQQRRGKEMEEIETKQIEDKEEANKSDQKKIINVVKKIEEESRKANIFLDERHNKEAIKTPPTIVEEVKHAIEDREEKPKRSPQSLPPPLPPLPPLPPPSSSDYKPREKRRSRTRSRERDTRRRSPIRRRDSSPPLRRRYSPPRRRSPPSRRRGSPRRRSLSPRSPRRRMSPPPRRRRRSPSLSPPPRSRARKRSPSPRIRRASPLNSPLDGFKRSVADSTISDDMLPQPNVPDDYVESPPTFNRKGSKKDSISPPISPKRIPLDDRINQVLGLEKNELPPKPPQPLPPILETAYSNYTYNPPYGQQYNQYTTQYGQYQKGGEYGPSPYGSTMFTQPPPPIAKPTPTPTKVVQVGNILQVVPTEEIPPQNIIENKVSETSQKIVQVGNMLQIVPAIIPPAVSATSPSMSEQSMPKPVNSPEKQSAEAIMKQKTAERKAEREKRRQERERRRKEKEKKRKEKERRKQMKLKIKTENMIKRAIQLEAEALACEDLGEEAENSEVPVQWPPVSLVISSTPSSCKGILVGEGASKKRKSVQFADGVRPGEGTSPSGGEELSSPPPHPPQLPKEKRYKKLKIPRKSKKKKIKVKVVKKKVQNTAEDEDDDDEEDDSLPPPSPPPGSPPPHVFPSRVKTHTVNNVHQFVGNIMPSSAAGFPFRPPMPMVISRHQPPPGYMAGAYHPDVSSLSHQPYQGVSSHH